MNTHWAAAKAAPPLHPGAGATVDSTPLSFEAHSNFASCADAWDRLEADGARTVFQRRAWIEAWWRTIGASSGTTLRIVVARRGRDPVLLYPFGLSRRLGARRLSWLAEDWSDYNAPLWAEEPEALGAGVWERVLAAAAPADIADLRKQPVGIDGIANPFLFSPPQPEPSSAHALRLEGPVQDILATVHGRKTLKRYESKERKLAREGELRYGVSAPSGAAADLAAMLGWKADALRAAGGSNPFADSAGGRFLTEVVSTAGAWAKIHRLTLDGRTIAAALMLEDRDTTTLYQTAYDQVHQSASPGMILIHKIITDAAERGFRRVDFGAGDEAYKRGLCNETIELGRSFSAISGVGKLFAAAAGAELAAKRWIKGTPAVYDAFCTLNRAAIRLKEAATGKGARP